MGGANYQARGQNSIASTNGSQYSPEVQKDRERVLKQSFNPDSSDYDYATAEDAGMLPSIQSGENFGHMGSVAPVNQNIYQKYKEYGLPSGDAYIVLKGASHPTHNYLVEGEAERGFEIKKFGDRYFSVPKQQKQNNIMGGSNSQALKNYKKYGMEMAQPDRGEGMSQETADAYAKYDKKSTSPNSFGRDASTVDPASVVKKKDVEMVKKPMTSYDAIDAGLR
jgi:hypothetical protein